MSSEKINHKSWYLIYSKSRKERSAQENLQRQGYQTYLPLTSQKRRRYLKGIVSVEPLFPRYVFIYLDAITDNWSPIRSTIGVSNIVSFDHMPAQVPDLLVSALMKNEDAQGVQYMSGHQFKPGDTIQITDGPMQHYQGIFMAPTNKERVMILLNILGNQTQSVLPADHIELVGV